MQLHWYQRESQWRSLQLRLYRPSPDTVTVALAPTAKAPRLQVSADAAEVHAPCVVVNAPPNAAFAGTASLRTTCGIFPDPRLLTTIENVTKVFGFTMLGEDMVIATSVVGGGGEACPTTL